MKARGLVGMKYCVNIEVLTTVIVNTCMCVHHYIIHVFIQNSPLTFPHSVCTLKHN